MRVTQVLLNFDLPPDLLFNAILDNFRFVQALEGEDVVGLGFGSDHVHATELALA